MTFRTNVLQTNSNRSYDVERNVLTDSSSGITTDNDSFLELIGGYLKTMLCCRSFPRPSGRTASYKKIDSLSSMERRIEQFNPAIARSSSSPSRLRYKQKVRPDFSSAVIARRAKAQERMIRELNSLRLGRYISSKMISFFQENNTVEFVDVIGNGSFGTAILVFHREFGNVVLKMCKDIDKAGLCVKNYRELRGDLIVLSLLQHPNLVNTLGVIIYDYENDGIKLIKDVKDLKLNQNYLVLGNFSQYIEFLGKKRTRDMYDEINGSEYLEYAQLQKNAYQIASALSHLHYYGVIHQDLKSENVFLDKEGNAYLGDFDLSELVTTKDGRKSELVPREEGDEDKEKGDKTKTKCGSPNYAAPEQFRRGMHDGKKADVFSLGALFYSMAYSRVLFNGKTDQELRDNVELFQGLVLEEEDIIPGYHHFEDLLHSVLRLDPDERLTVDQVLEHPFFEGCC
jgi:serine/threonine protein kinase